jgi:hypothetical protein
MNMTKKQTLINFIIFLVVIIVLSAWVLKTKYNFFKFDEETIPYAFFGEVSTAEDFCKTKGANTVLHGKYLYAKAYDDGSLLLVIDNNALRSWKNADWILQVLQSLLEESGRDIGVDIDWTEDEIEAKKKIKTCGIEVSEDFSEFIIGPGDDRSFFPFLVSGCMRQQIFMGKQVSEISVTQITVDENGDIIDEFRMDFSEEQEG